MNYTNFLTIKYPVTGSVFFNNTLTIHYTINKLSYEQLKIAFQVDGGIVYYDSNLTGTFSIPNISEGSHKLIGYLVNNNNVKIPKTDFSVSFSTYENTLNIENKITNVLKTTIPDFVKEDYPTFVSFLKAYYEWMYSSNNPFYAPLIQEDYKDIDRTPELFIKFFRSQYLKDFPQSLTLDKQTGTPLNIKTLIKNINDFYSSKGNESSVKFLLNILYDSYSELYYPRVDIFKASESLWIKPKSIKFNYNDSKMFSIKNKELVLKKGETILWKAFIENVQQYRSAYKEIIEVFFTNEEGSLNFNFKFEVDTGEEIIFLTPLKSITGFTIVDGGLNYEVNDIIEIIKDSQVVAYAKVTKVNEYGSITEYEMVNFGVVTESLSLYEVLTKSEIGNDGSITGIIEDYVCNYGGYWTKKNSHPDSIKKLQDNYRYQNLSYVIRTNKKLENYIGVLKKLVHPAGFAVLGDILLLGELSEPVTTLRKRDFYYIPFIGNYAAYRPSTNVNVRGSTDLFPDGFDPDQPIPDQDGSDNPHTAVNPLSEGVESLVFGFLPEVSDIDEVNNYWVVYPHPNTIINTAVGTETILNLKIKDFVRQKIEENE